MAKRTGIAVGVKSIAAHILLELVRSYRPEAGDKQARRIVTRSEALIANVVPAGSKQNAKAEMAVDSASKHSRDPIFFAQSTFVTAALR